MDENYAKFLLAKVQKDYEKISSVFAQKRAKPWPQTSFLFNYIKPGEKVLDLGCGPGQYFEFVEQKGGDYFGVDFSEKLIEIAKNRYPKGKFYLANALKLPFPENFFDKVYAIAFVHHLPSKNFRTKALEQIKRVLKKKGLLILTVWNLWKKNKKLIFKFLLLKILGKSKLDFGDILLKWQGIDDFYFHCFTKSELKNLVKKLKFAIIEEGEFLVGEKVANSNFYFIFQK